jgi:hypothetical protein
MGMIFGEVALAPNINFATKLGTGGLTGGPCPGAGGPDGPNCVGNPNRCAIGSDAFSTI